MSRIDGLGNGSPIRNIPNKLPAVYRQIPADAPQQLPLTDKLELSGNGHLLELLKTNDMRTDKVASVRAQLDTGTYEDDHKLNIAVDRLLDDLLSSSI